MSIDNVRRDVERAARSNADRILCGKFRTPAQLNIAHPGTEIAERSGGQQASLARRTR